jgi:mRNA interferase RelE/StbE
MAFYRIDVKKSVFKDINKLNEADVPQVLRAIEALSKNPRSNQSIKLSGSEHSYRLRVGKYRILYQIDDSLKVITVFAVGHRKDIYK